MAVEFVETSDFKIGHRKKEYIMETHFHDDIEILIHINGGKYCFAENCVYNLEPNDIMIFDSNQIHRIVTDDSGEYERYVITYKNEFVTLLDKEYWQVKYRIMELAQLNQNIFKLDSEAFEELLGKLNYYFEDFHVVGNLHKTSAFLDIISFIFNNCLKSEGVEARQYSHATIEAIIKTIDENYLDEKFSLDFLSDKLHMNKCYICSMFKKVTGFTVYNYIAQKKIKAAKQMLIQGHSINECAEKLAFHDYNDFIRVFKKIAKITPGKYAKA